MVEVSKPYRDDPAKQERFEQFLKEKYHGGLRSTDSGGANNMSEAARARERVDFDAAAEAIEKGHWRKEFTEGCMESSSTGGMQFTSGGIEVCLFWCSSLVFIFKAFIHIVYECFWMQQSKSSKDEDLMTKALYPKREEFQWRPSPILCKRFDLIDPYMGKVLIGSSGSFIYLCGDKHCQANRCSLVFALKKVRVYHPLFKYERNWKNMETETNFIIHNILLHVYCSALPPPPPLVKYLGSMIALT